MFEIMASPILNVSLKGANGTTPFFVVNVYQHGINKKIICNWTKAVMKKSEIKFSDFGEFKQNQLWSVSGCNGLLQHRFIEPMSKQDLKEKVIVTLLSATDKDVILFCWDDKDIHETGFYEALGMIDDKGQHTTPDKDSLSLESHGLSLKEGSMFALIDLESAFNDLAVQ